MYKNFEGYSDPTAGQAVGNLIREYKQQQRERWHRQYEMKNRPKIYAASKYTGDVSKSAGVQQELMEAKKLDKKVRFVKEGF